MALSMQALAASDPVQALAMEFPDLLFKETVLFFYCAAIGVELMSNEKMYTFVHLIFLALIRAFGSYGVVLPLLLGQLPNRAFESSDTYLWSLATGLFYSGFFVAHVLPPKIHKFFLYVNRFCHSVIRGNSLGHGFSMTVNLAPSSLWAPFLGGVAAVCGHKVLEGGVNAFQETADADVLFGLFGSFIYFVLVQYVAMPAALARALLVLIHFSMEWGWMEKVADKLTMRYALFKDMVQTKIAALRPGKKAAVAVSMKAAPAAKSMKRGRSKTPAKKK
mmetsp:Transcript_12268/g.29751  ORF Transcript_12268/g.29751 Transcript_12268/m.29751 type:complete len:277 (+) Transcript_12268:107-937(+)|eukprot:CAMPEP_0178994818 /NCGR_PEP_ID=MMETSP0795-20121207/7482_1 /TAXON_ID=88552 /ORGANISM="Amoebophrya sp., Strain Ameob2" /LENGTH=276 /DNA_ID=CAMNT_0020687055 /DNA_START=128 /DNA_END=958 /DNA_ORIENTATION=+